MQATNICLKKSLKRPDRIKKRSDFLSVQKMDSKWFSKTLILQTRPNDLEKKRVGFTVTKKTCPLAVDRNRIKRRFRALADHILSLKAKNNTDYVIVGRKEALNAPFDQLEKDLLWCLKRLDLLDTAS